MELLKGKIQINPKTGTVSILMDDNSHTSEQYPNGIKHWLENHIKIQQERLDHN